MMEFVFAFAGGFTGSLVAWLFSSRSVVKERVDTVVVREPEFQDPVVAKERQESALIDLHIARRMGAL